MACGKSSLGSYLAIYLSGEGRGRDGHVQLPARSSIRQEKKA